MLRLNRPGTFCRVLSSTTPVVPPTPFRSRVDVSKEEHEELLKLAPIRAFFEPSEAQRDMVGLPSPIPGGRPWFARELRMKSFEDLHALHFVLLKERNKLASEKVRRRNLGLVLPSPERWAQVRASMARLQTVMGERAREDAAEREVRYLTEPKPPKSPLRIEWDRRRAAVAEQVPNRENQRGTGRGAGGAKTRERIKAAVDLEDSVVISTSSHRSVAFNKMPSQVKQVMGETKTHEHARQLLRVTQDRAVRVTRHEAFVRRTKPKELRKEEPAWVTSIKTGFKTKSKPDPNRWPREGDW